MNKRAIFAVLLLVAGLQTAWAQSVIVNLKNGRKVIYNVEELDSIYFNTLNGIEEHEWVDLGLPSGTLWATMNVGANAPEEFGDYFAWGETTPSMGVDWSTYKYSNGTNLMLTKYCTNTEYGFNGFIDGLTELLPEDDAASVNWGNGCQMPSMSQCYELMNDAYTTKETFWINDVRVNKITSLINGNYILLPPAGWYDPSGQYNIGGGSYWSRSLDKTESFMAFGMYFDARTLMPGISRRINGYSVRPVQKLNKEIVHVTNVALSDTLLVLDVGDVVQLTTTIEPSNATFPAVIWEFNTPAITISTTGKVTALRPGTATVTCRSTDIPLEARCRVIVRQEHDYVDLGLPSGTLWATTNIGANAPEQYGDYFAWGETEPKESFNWYNYKFCFNGNYNLMTKYNCDEGSGFQDYLGCIEPEDDAASANWGKKWQMPGMGDFYELYDDMYTMTTFTTLNGVSGMKITSKINGNSIFLPSAGCYDSDGINNAGSYGFYWSYELGSASYSAWNMEFYSGGMGSGNNSRYYGMNIRPVRVEKVEREQHDYVDLGLPSGTLWATCNVGANSPEERGDRFAWAETETKEAYEVDNYKYGGYLQMEKYCTNWEIGMNDGNTMLELMDDAAVVNWGAEWQTPSKSQFKELINSEYTTTEPTTQNGVKGWRITSKRNGNSIFLPSTSSDSSLNEGTYWSRNLYPFFCDMAYALIFNSNSIETSYSDRMNGEFVRPVKYKDPILVSGIELNHTQLILDLYDSERLSATVLPANADNKYVVWETSDEDVVMFQDEMWISPQSPGTCTITCRSTDGSHIYAECHITVLPHHEYVNLGLPSGTIWAACNVGADKAEDYGDFFAWAETEPKETYSYDTYKYWIYTDEKTQNFTKYCNDSEYGYEGFTDGLTVLLPEDDAATANWGSIWQTPSWAQYEELFDETNTTATWTTKNGVQGYLIKSRRNLNTLFLPAAGYLHYNEHYYSGSNGYYWTNEQRSSPNFAVHYDLSDRMPWFEESYRVFGMSVRPVRTKEPFSVEKITLDKTELKLILGREAQLTATVLPEDALNKDLRWWTSNDRILTVDAGRLTPLATGTCTIRCYAADNSGVFGECKVTVLPAPEHVDLGLPSGTLWATCNVGASSPEDYGDLFSWGNTQQQYFYNWPSYVWGDGSYNSVVIKYNQDDGLTELLPEDDAATALWGEEWQMPSMEQFEELINSEYTNVVFLDEGDSSGLLISKKSDADVSIFLPAAGLKDEDNPWGANQGTGGFYWSRMLVDGISIRAYEMYFRIGQPYLGTTDYLNVGGTPRNRAQSIRPVRKQ